MEFDDIEKIGLRIKEIRKKKSITIQRLSQFTDLSVGYLSNLERNQASPTLNNLQRICVTLGISVRDLLEPSGEEKTLLPRSEQRSFRYDEYKLDIRRLDFGKKRGIYEYSSYDAPEEGEEIEASWGLHPYAEARVVLEGTMEVCMDGKTYILEEGDAIYIRPNTYHTIRNAGKTPCRSFWHLQIAEGAI